MCCADQLNPQSTFDIQGILLFTACIKLSARILKAPTVTWKQCLLFALIAMWSITVFSSLTYAFLPRVVVSVGGGAMAMGLGAWFLGSRSIENNGGTLGWREGMQLSVIAVGAGYGFQLTIGFTVLRMIARGIYYWLTVLRFVPFPT